MKISYCRNCGSGCLSDEPLEDCNNCNAKIKKLIADAAEYEDICGGEEAQMKIKG